MVNPAELVKKNSAKMMLLFFALTSFLLTSCGTYRTETGQSLTPVSFFNCCIIPAVIALGSASYAVAHDRFGGLKKTKK